MKNNTQELHCLLSEKQRINKKAHNNCMFRKLIFLTQNIIQESGSQANFIFVLNNNQLDTFTGINGSFSINALTCFDQSKSNISETIL
jgi:hypothetical protein